MQLQVTMQDGTVWMSTAANSVEATTKRLPLYKSDIFATQVRVLTLDATSDRDTS